MLAPVEEGGPTLTTHCEFCNRWGSSWIHVGGQLVQLQNVWRIINGLEENALIKDQRRPLPTQEDQSERRGSSGRDARSPRKVLSTGDVRGRDWSA